MSILCMLGKDCYDNPISTFPPCYAFQMNWPLGGISIQVAMSVIGKKNFETVGPGLYKQIAVKHYRFVRKESVLAIRARHLICWERKCLYY